MIETYLLEQLAVFAKCGTLSAAAQELHISQPALSKSMQKLEQQLGITIFERSKNRISLNETGKLAAEQAENMLASQREMIERIKAFDRARHTICLGSCAPVPVSDIVPLLSGIYKGMTISAELKDSDEVLLEGLGRGMYQMVVLHQEPEEDQELFVFPYRQEHLALLVPMQHPLAACKELRLRDLKNQNLLIHTQIGFWGKLSREKLPTCHFLYMDEWDAYQQLSEAGSFPTFTTEAFADSWSRSDKKVVPIVDDEVNVTYYFACSANDRHRFQPLIRQLQENFSVTKDYDQF